MSSGVSLTLARFTASDRDRWLSAAAGMLSEDERAGLGSITDLDARTQHALGRALIRLAGAAAERIPSSQVQIAVSAAGKPELTGLGVSIAHSQSAVLLGACAASAVGVDIETVREDHAATRRLIERRFSPSEAQAARELPDDCVGEWFARVWTIKEAVGKALGVGIFPALSGVVVAGGRDRLELAATPSGPAAATWTLHQLEAPYGRERIAVALPAPGIALTEVRRLTLDAFVRAGA